MNSFVAQIGNAVVVLGVSGLFSSASVWAAAPAVHSARPAGGSTVHTAPSSSASHTSVHPAAAKVSGQPSSHNTITSSSGSVGSTTMGGNLVLKRNDTKSPAGASKTVPAGGGHVLGVPNVPSKNVDDLADAIGDAWRDIFHPAPFKAAPQPAAQPSPIWSGSSSSVASAGTNAKGTAPRASISLKNGEQVQKHLDQVATANSPAGKIQKGQEIQKQMGNSSGKTKSSGTGPAAQLQKGQQIQKQMENMNASTSRLRPAVRAA